MNISQCIAQIIRSMILYPMHTKARQVLRSSCGEVEGRARTPGSLWDTERVYSAANMQSATFRTRWEAKTNNSQGHHPLTSNMAPSREQSTLRSDLCQFLIVTYMEAQVYLHVWPTYLTFCDTRMFISLHKLCHHEFTYFPTEGHLRCSLWSFYD